MITRLVRFDDPPRGPRWGVVVGDAVHVVDGDFPTTGALLERGRDAIADARSRSRGDRRPLTSVLDAFSLLSPITDRQQVVCQAVNYRDHAIEAGFGPDGLGANVVFRKASSSLASARADLVRPREVRLLDYELELGLVIGRRIDRPIDVSWDDLHEFVAGVVILDDVSARDVQVRDGQFFRSKSYRGFGPTGPFLCLLAPETIRRIPELTLVLQVDGEERQRGRADQMIHPPPETIAELSRVVDLDAGDLVATGTPRGVALRVPSTIATKLAGLLPSRWRDAAFLRSQLGSRRYLRAGQTIEATIRTDDGAIDLGTMRTRIVDGV